MGFGQKDSLFSSVSGSLSLAHSNTYLLHKPFVGEFLLLYEHGFGEGSFPHQNTSLTSGFFVNLPNSTPTHHLSYIKPVSGIDSLALGCLDWLRHCCG